MISVVILAHDAVEMTRGCITALLRSQVDDQFEVVCVDNGSTAPFDPLFSEFCRSVPAVRFIRNESNLSFSRANNLAVAQARGDILLFLNNDVFVGRESLAAVTEPLQEDGPGITGARLLYPDGTTVQHGGIRQMLWRTPSNFGVGALVDDRRVATRTPVFAVTGAMLAVSRRLFEAIGGFDEGYRWGYEDVDLCMKSWEAGRPVIYVPEHPSIHCESATLRDRRRGEDDDANGSRFEAKWHGVLARREAEYLSRLVESGVRRVVVFGTGRAARSLSRALRGAGIEIAAFTCSPEYDAPPVFCDRPVVPLESVRALSLDRLVVASQFFFQLESRIAPYDPDGSPLFPVVW